MSVGGQAGVQKAVKSDRTEGTGGRLGETARIGGGGGVEVEERSVCKRERQPGGRGRGEYGTEAPEQSRGSSLRVAGLGRVPSGGQSEPRAPGQRQGGRQPNEQSQERGPAPQSARHGRGQDEGA